MKKKNIIGKIKFIVLLLIALTQLFPLYLSLIHIFLKGNCLSLILNILMFGNFLRFVWIAQIVQFFKSYKLFAVKRSSVKGKGNFHFHSFAVSDKRIITFHTFSIDKKLCICLLYTSNLYGLLALLLTSGAGLAGIVFYKRRKMKKS